MPVPPLLRDLAGWAWRVIVLGFFIVEALHFINILYFIVLPFAGALLATCLAHPMVRWLRSHGVSRPIATWITVLVAAVVFGGIAIFVVDRAVAEYPDFVDQLKATVTHFRNFLTNDLHVKSSSTDSINKTITDYLDAHSTTVASGALSGIATVAEALGAFVLWFFMTFFLLYDGEAIWAWMVGLFPSGARDRVVGAGAQAWIRLAGYVRGTFIIAIVHAVVAAITLTILGVPLVAPLTVLVFFGSFLPIVGSIIFGGLAVAIALVTQGHVAGIVLTIVLIADNQFEAHVLQPFVVGKYVRLHPLAVAVSIAAGGVLEGLAGAVLAVPTVAVLYAVMHFLATGETDDPPPDVKAPDPPPVDGSPDGEDSSAAVALGKAAPSPA
jgi:predicted PurR-regulated permease PerM